MGRPFGSNGQPSQDQGEELYMVTDVARHFHVDETTVRRWVREGSMQAVKLPHKGKRIPLRFTGDQVRQIDPNFGKEQW